jgi:hypothetical protein
MDVITNDSESDIRAMEKYQEISSMSKEGEIGKSAKGSQEMSAMTRGISERASNTIGHPAKTAKTTKNPWTLNFGRAR